MAGSRRKQFIADTLAAELDTCVIWPFARRNSSGYGAFDICVDGKKKSLDAHRYVCREAHGEPAPGEQASHRCGNKLCVNPRHLYWADALTNMADAKRHGTLRGGGCGRQRFFAEQIADICTSGESLLALAAKYNSDVSYMGRIRREYSGNFA
jgi:hypothetical protein